MAGGTKGIIAKISEFYEILKDKNIMRVFISFKYFFASWSEIENNCSTIYEQFIRINLQNITYKTTRVFANKNTFSSRVKLLREPWCETNRSAGGAIIRIPASLIRDAKPLYIAALQLFSFLLTDGQQSDLRRARFTFR